MAQPAPSHIKVRLSNHESQGNTYAPYDHVAPREGLEITAPPDIQTTCKHCLHCQGAKQAPVQASDIYPETTLSHHYDRRFINASSTPPKSDLWSGKPTRLLDRYTKVSSPAFWKAKFKKRPRRPLRPLPQHCPGWPIPHCNTRTDPTQARFPMLQQDITSRGSLSPCIANETHHDRAYYLLTGEKPNATTLQMDTGHDNMKTRLEHAEVPTYAPLIDLSRHMSNLSTTTMTASQPELKPSPLRPVKSPLFETPYIPAMLQLDALSEFEYSQSHILGNSSCPVPAYPRDSSSFDRTNSSVYSLHRSTYTAQHVDTPPSTPPPIPIRHPSHCYRNDLAKKHIAQTEVCGLEAESELNQRGTTYGSDATGREVPRLCTHPGASRTRHRVEKERVRKHAEAKLTGIESDLPFSTSMSSTSSLDERPVNFLGFLETGQLQSLDSSTDISDILNPGQSPVMRFAFDSDQSLLQEPTESRTENVAQEEQEPIEPADAALHLRQYDPEVSLVELRARLRSLMQEDEEQGPLRATELTQTVPESDRARNDTVRHSRSSSNPSSSPLQRIEIEHNGKRYPVLIGDRAKVYEEPCQYRDCCLHGRETNEIEPIDYF